MRWLATFLATGTSVFAGATPTAAQQHVGPNHAEGLHWAVAAPDGAAWVLDCRFRPVTLYMNQYDRRQWANQLTRRGQGPQNGRLPGDNGRCVLTKIGGLGPVGVALIKNGVATAQGTNTGREPARVDVF